MKFEKPIAEVEQFELKDVISVSGGNGETEPAPSTTESQYGTAYWEDGIPCTYTKEDNYNFNNCL